MGPAAATVEALLGGWLDDAARSALACRASVDLGLSLGGRARARLNVYRTHRGLAAALRFLPEAPRSLDDLGAPLPLEDLAMLPSGLVLTTGATGSGKSTTLAALAATALRRRSIVLVTLEDPIEHELFAPPPGAHVSVVRQRQIGREVADFPSGLRDALREDPDVILIGEMRDAESIALALTAAETGHLVLASLHARSAASAVDRIVDATPAAKQGQVRQQLADALRAVVAQRLLPRIGGGRVLAAEILRGTTAVSSAIREGKTGVLKSAMQSGRSAGMIPLERSIADLVRARIVALEAARAACLDVEALEGYLGERG
jgi:twitching motility protein PilT